MTITTNNPGPATFTGPSARPGFQPIPTRIRDVRDSQGVPPLVVESVDVQKKAAVEQSLAELGGKLAEIHRTAAEAYMSQGSYDKAVPHLQAAVDMVPTEPEFHHQLGFVRYVTGDDAAAIQSFNAVLGIDPQNSEAWFNLGMVLFGQSQFAEAETCFARSLERRQGDAQTWNNRGVCLWQLGRAQDARQCFQQALQIDPNDMDARFNLQNIG